MFPRPEVLSHLDWSAVAQTIARGDRFVLTTHVRADTDGLGSEIALHRYLASQGKQVRIINDGAMLDKLRFLDPSGAVEAYLPEHGRFIEEADAIILVDLNEVDRLGAVTPHVKAASGQVITVDHHANGRQHHAGLSVIELAAASTGVLIYDLLLHLGARIDPVVAQALYATIVADTGSFRFSNTTAEVLRIAAHLIEAGADPQVVYRGVLGSFTKEKFKLLGRAMAEIAVELDGRFAWLYVSRTMLAETGSGEAEVDGLIEYLRLLRGVNLSVLLLQVDDTEVKASFRSEEHIDVNRLAATWGGGGHVHAAGATVTGPAADTVREIVERARQFVS